MASFMLSNFWIVISIIAIGGEMLLMFLAVKKHTKRANQKIVNIMKKNKILYRYYNLENT